MLKQCKFITIATFCLITAAPIVHAACSSPAGVAGEMGFDITGTGKFEYCNNTAWILMHDTASASSFNSVSAGTSHSCAVGANGKAYCWGSRGQGRLGDGLTSGSSTEPVEVHDGENTGGHDFIQINTGESHSCGIATNNKSYCWGSGDNGKLGHGSTDDESEIVRTHNGENAGGNFTQVSAGENHSCGIGTNGKAYCWGSQGQGRLGNGTLTGTEFTPDRVHDGENAGGNFAQVSAGINHSCGIGTDGKAYCWGDGANGRLGNGASLNQTEPVEVHDGENTGGGFTQVVAGVSHSCGFGSDGKAYCWGAGISGRLGNGASSAQTEPVEVHDGENTGGDFGATCTTSGELDYNTTKNIFEWCGGDNLLYAVSAEFGLGGAGCAASGALIAGSEGAMQYDTTNNKMVFCGGTNWIDIPN